MIGGVPWQRYESLSSSFWLDGDSPVLAGMNVNVWDVVDDVKGLIRSGT